MSIIQLVGIALIACFLSLTLKDQLPQFALVISLIAGVFLFVYAVTNIGRIWDMIELIAKEANMESIYLKTILKMIGVAYLVEMTSQLLVDAGEKSLAGKIEMAGKIFILLMALPILQTLIQTILHFIPSS
jgi:stage III sporulation protein AD